MLPLKQRVLPESLRRPAAVVERTLSHARVVVYRSLGLSCIEPTFLIVGAQKAATTSLFMYLCRHPSVLPPLKKEIHYFDINAEMSLDWYFAHFPVAHGRTNGTAWITGEASPYYMFHPLVPRRIAQRFPRMRIIIMLRNPVARALSHYHHEVRLRRERLPIMEALQAEEGRLMGEEQKIIRDDAYVSFNHQHYSYFARGLYVDQIKRFEGCFPKNQIMIVESEQLRNQPEQVYQGILKFLDLQPRSLDAPDHYNKGKYQKIPEEAMAWLKERYREPNQRLFDHLNTRFDW
jgi:Sulfotransferase domain